MGLDSSTSHTRSISAFFDTKGAAQKAVDDLIDAGIPRGQVEFVEGRAQTAEAAKPREEMGFWAALTNLFMPEQDRYAYSEGLNRGGYLLVVRCDEAMYPRVLELLDTDGAVDLDDREGQWRQEGWSGLPATPAASAAPLRTEADYPLGGDTAAMAGRAFADPVPGVRRDTGIDRTRVRGYHFDQPEPRESDSSGPSRFSAATDAAQIAEHMDVIASDGQKIGTVDHLDGPDRIRLAKSTSPDGQHHTIPLAWVHHVDTHVHLNKGTADVRAGW